jgi:glycosyltransferase involved in cell wall biosynthesis
MRAIYVHDINRHLVRRGHRVRVVVPGRAGVPAREVMDGVEIVRFPFELPADLAYGHVAQGKVGPLGKVGRILTMGRYLLAQYRAAVAEGITLEADIVHGHWAIPTGPAIVASARRLGRPSVITMHGGDVYVNKAQGYDFPLRWYIKPILRRTLRGASALTAISDDCRLHAINAGAVDSSVHIVMNGADLRRFSPGPRESRINGLEISDQMIFACRQLFPRKGIRFLLEAAAKLVPKHPGVQVVIAGDGFERPALEKLARDLGIAERTVFLGWVANSDLPVYFRSCAVSVIPSLEEGFGIPAAEAMGCAVPVIASDAGGLPEVVDDGRTGLVVPKGDADALAHALGTLLADPDRRRSMGELGRARALERFDWDCTARRFEAVYSSVLRP